MTDVNQLNKEVHLASLAADVLENPVYQEAFAALEQDLKNQWLTVKELGPQGREKVYEALRLLEQIRLHLEKTMTTGNMARMELAEIAKKESRLKVLADHGRKWIGG